MSEELTPVEEALSPGSNLEVDLTEPGRGVVSGEGADWLAEIRPATAKVLDALAGSTLQVSSKEDELFGQGQMQDDL